MKSILRFAVGALLATVFGAPAQAEPRAFTGMIRLEFPSAQAPVKWAVPIAGVGKYQPGTATSTQEAFVISNPVTMVLGTSTSVMGSVPNPFPGTGTFDTGQVLSFKLQQGLIPIASTGNLLGLRVTVASLDLSGITASGAGMTFNHPLLRLGTSFVTFHPGANYLTTSSSYSASGFDSSWSATVHSLGYGGGDLNLVTPVSLSTTSGGTLNGQAKLELTFAPEPTMGLMFVAGAGGLFFLGRRRQS